MILAAKVMIFMRRKAKITAIEHCGDSCFIGNLSAWLCRFFMIIMERRAWVRRHRISGANEVYKLERNYSKSMFFYGSELI